MFKPVPSKINLPLMEEGILRFWKREHIFEKSMAQREGSGSTEFVFYEKPPTANRKPGAQHALELAFKDLFPRYKTMRGYHVLRRGGWDTHGLPVEIEVEKRLGLNSKSEIEAYGIEPFNTLCRKSAFEYIQDWEKLTDRIGYWADQSEAFVTYTNEYIESVWWILKNFWDKGLLYQGFKVVPYCPRCGTPLSDHEVSQGYAQTDDPSAFVRLPLADDPQTSLLVWTTTPWTLTGNAAVAANPDLEYLTVERDIPEGGSERLILARSLLEKVFGSEPVRVLETYKGYKLKGKHYHPLFTFLLPDKPAYTVILEDFVTAEFGTGLVPIAPAFGAQDMEAAQEFDLPLLVTVTEGGTFIPEVRPWSGKFVKDADPLVISDLASRGLLFKVETTTHTSPFCWRCNTPLLYFARGTWFIRTSQFKDKLAALNQEVSWRPEGIKSGRFGDWLENNVDWVLGRERYWGTPLPVWECEDCHHQRCIGSMAELADFAGNDPSSLDLHRPSIDRVQLPCPECGGAMKRVPEVIDVWFDSGSMPVAQWHYPFENQETFQSQFPADLICEAVGQTRGWFYALHAISTMLFESPSYKNAIGLGLVADTGGQKSSNLPRTLPEPWDTISQYGADALRWSLYTAGPPGQERHFSTGQVEVAVRNCSLVLWNVYRFFTIYANIDGWEPSSSETGGYQAAGPAHPEGPAAERSNPLDRWLLSELHTLIRDATTAFETYNIPGVALPIQAFIERLSRWYVRRSRRRFWGPALSPSDPNKPAGEKENAYRTLYETLVTLSKLLAPVMPFLAEELYQNLVRSWNENAPESVHLTDWPLVDSSLIDGGLNEDMSLVLKLASLGHAAREKAGIKVRQPLAEIAFSAGSQAEVRIIERYASLLADELNVKQVRVLGSDGEIVVYSIRPLPERLGQRYKNLFPKISAAIQDLDVEGTARAVLEGIHLFAGVEGQAYEILPEDVEVRIEARSEEVVASDGAHLAALKTELTPDLIKEGLTRQFVRHVQVLRKQAGMDIAGRIHLYVEASPALAEAITVFRERIMEETLAVSLSSGKPPESAATAQVPFDGQQATISIRKG
jgi:isoleucyl-tRNA synthetase